MDATAAVTSLWEKSRDGKKLKKKKKKAHFLLSARLCVRLLCHAHMCPVVEGSSSGPLCSTNAPFSTTDMQTRSNLERRWNHLFRFRSYILLFLLPFSVCHPHNVPLRRVGTAVYVDALSSPGPPCRAARGRPPTSWFKPTGQMGARVSGSSEAQSKNLESDRTISRRRPEPLGESVTFSDWWVIAPVGLKPVFPQELNDLVSIQMTKTGDFKQVSARFQMWNLCNQNTAQH